MQHNERMQPPVMPSRPSFLRRHWMLGVGLAAAVAGAGVAWMRLRPEAASPGAATGFWSQRFMRPEGGELAMADYRGRPLLVNFWATWCPPCIEELPMMEAFWREHGAKGLQIVALAIDQPSSVRRFLERQPLSFPIGLAGMEGSQLAKSLGNAAGGLPYSVFFGKDGRIYKQKLGQLHPEDLDRWRDASL
jgi:thiol-disulfide isomerase/thioredoxin